MMWMPIERWREVIDAAAAPPASGPRCCLTGVNKGLPIPEDRLYDMIGRTRKWTGRFIMSLFNI